MNTFVVTGAAGFIGYHLTRELLSSGHAVIGVDNLNAYYSPALKHANLASLSFSPGFSFRHLDLSDSKSTRRLPPVDYVIHLAGQPGVRNSWSDLQGYSDHNIVALGNLLKHYVDTPPDRIVIASSSSVYGNNPSRLPTIEDHPLHPHSPYGVTKAAAEALAHAYTANKNLPITILRYFSVYGPRQRPDMLFARLIRSIQRGATVRIFGGGTAERDFTYVDDVVAATVAAANTELPPGTTINVASGSPVRVNTAIDLIAQICGRQPRITPCSAVPGDVNHTWASIEKAKQLLGWEPQTTLQQGLTHQISSSAEVAATEEYQSSYDA